MEKVMNAWCQNFKLQPSEAIFAPLQKRSEKNLVEKEAVQIFYSNG